MIRTFNVEEKNFGYVEVDIPDGCSEDKVNELVMQKINDGFAVYNDQEVNYEPYICPNDTHDNIMLYIPSLDKSVFFHQGIGDNLLEEDIEQGLNDYCIYFVYNGKVSKEDYLRIVEEWVPEWNSLDEGQWLFNNKEITYFLDGRILIPYILDMSFGNNNLKYEIIGDNDEYIS